MNENSTMEDEEYRVNEDILYKQLKCMRRFARILHYYREIRKRIDNIGCSKKEKWFLVETLNSHLRMSVIDWCKIFGTDDNEIHWKKAVITNSKKFQNEFRQKIYKATGLNSKEWGDYHREMIGFRNKYVAHYVKDYDEPVPKMDNALTVAFAYDEWLWKEKNIVSFKGDLKPLSESITEYRNEAIEVLNKIQCTKIIDSQKTLVAYLDILGYKDIISKESPKDFYDSIKNVFEGVRILRDSVQPNKVESNVEREQQCTADLLKTMGFKILSDAIIMYWDYNDIELVNNKFYEKIDYDYSGTVILFNMISAFVLLFTARTGYLLRGGVCLGKFYTNTFDSCLLNGEFIFSEALVRGYELEQLANHPRILVDETLYNLWKSKVESVSKHKSATISQVKQDKDGEFYIDNYEIIRTCTVNVKKEWLANIIKQINHMLVAKKDDRRVWEKWHWFKEYHNEKIRSFAQSENQDLDELLIN